MSRGMAPARAWPGMADIPHCGALERAHYWQAMTDQYTFLSPAALRDIIANLDQSLAVFDRYPGRLPANELQVKKMLIALRARLIEQLENHPEQGQEHR